MDKRLALKILLSIVIFLATCLIYSFIEPYFIKVNNIEIVDSDIPESFENKKIVFVADIHHGPFFSRKRVKKLVEQVNKLNPDIIILGGDYVHGSPQYILPCFEELQKLNAKIDKFGVIGNHDNWESTRLTEKGMKIARIKILENEAYWIFLSKDKIKIGGTEDLWTGFPDAEPTIKNTKKEDFVILVTHNPDYVEEIKTPNIDLILGGHNHGGQITLFGLYAPIMFSDYGQKYKSGIVETNNTKVVVTNGIGMVNLPLRFFARPEIVVLSLKRI